MWSFVEKEISGGGGGGREAIEESNICRKEFFFLEVNCTLTGDKIFVC